MCVREKNVEDGSTKKEDPGPAALVLKNMPGEVGLGVLKLVSDVGPEAPGMNI